MNIEEHVSNLLEKLCYMSEATLRKCEMLKSSNELNQTVVCENIITLCTKIRQNCESFESGLIELSSECNIELSRSRNVNSDNYNLELILSNVIGKYKFERLNEEQLKQFQLDLSQFTKSYWDTLTHVTGNNGQIKDSEGPTLLSDTQDSIFQQLKQIFGSDSESEPVSTNDDKSTKVNSNKEYSEKIDECGNHSKSAETLDEILSKSVNDEVSKSIEQPVKDGQLISDGESSENNKNKTQQPTNNGNEEADHHLEENCSNEKNEPEQVLHDSNVSTTDNCTKENDKPKEIDGDSHREENCSKERDRSEQTNNASSSPDLLPSQDEDATQIYDFSSISEHNNTNNQVSSSGLTTGIRDSQETQAYDVGSQFDQLNSPSEKYQLDENSDSSEKNQFLSGLGLSKSDNYDKTQHVRDELMDIMAEVEYEMDGCGEMVTNNAANEDSILNDSGSYQYTDKDAADALKYLEDTDSDNESVKTLESLDSLSSSDFKYLESELSETVTEEIKLQNPSQLFSQEEVASEENQSDLDEKEVHSTVENANMLETKFVPKKCRVLLSRMNIENCKKMPTSENLEETRNRKHTNESDEQNMDSDKVKFVPKDCYVRLEHFRLTSPSSDSEFENRCSLTDEETKINRLCNLSGLSKKRIKHSNDEPNRDKRKKFQLMKRKRKRVDLSGSETSDLSGFDSVSEDEIKNMRESLWNENSDGEDKVLTAVDPNLLLSEIVCHTIHSTDSDSSSISENENRNCKTREEKNKKHKKQKLESSEKDSWKNDSLLTGNLNISSDTIKKPSKKREKRKDSSSDNDSDKSSKKPIKTHKKLDPDWESDTLISESTSNSSSDESEDFPLPMKLPKEEITDSDVELIDSTSPVKSRLEGERNSDKKKSGRRNILSILSQANLTEETQRAAKEEGERLMQLEKRNQMRSSQCQENTTDCIVLDIASDDYKVTIDPALSKRMFDHQIKGVQFMWDTCYLSIDALDTFPGTGCILAHNMGLGKTFQVVTLVHTLFRHTRTKTKHVLVVCPLSTVAGWRKEFITGLNIAVITIPMKILNVESSDDSSTKCYKVMRWKAKGGVLIMGYEAFEKLTRKTNPKSKILREALIKPGPDLVVCDEGHLLKNGKALRTMALMEIKTKRRIALTGTPLQNNLTEYYHMVQFVKPNILGTKNEFLRQFVNPIMNGQYEDSVEADIKLMKKRTHVLHRLLRYTVQRYEATELKKYLQTMKDYALFIQLHPVQEQLYRKFIELSSSRIDPKTKKRMRMFFNDFQIAKFICSHPQLLYTMEAQNAEGKKKKIKETDVISEEPEVQEVDGIPSGWWKPICPEDVKTNIEFGTKLVVMLGILEEAEKLEDKVLIFTSSLVELNSIEYFLKLKGTSTCPSWKSKKDYFRMDGTVHPSIRTKMCEMFNNKSNKKMRVFLMSHKVGGLGLNLVSANRVILLGANFNPSLDSQSIYRAYRFGQNKPVYIYRLISMGTMEEKIYHRCVTKLAIASRVVDKHQITRHYKNLNLLDLYTVAINLSLEKPTPSKPDDDLLANLLLKYDCIHKYHLHQKLLENRPDEDLDEQDKMNAWEEFVQINENKNLANKTPEPSIPLINTNISQLIRTRWEQINQPGPSNFTAPQDPLSVNTSIEWQAAQLNYLSMFASAQHASPAASSNNVYSYPSVGTSLPNPVNTVTDVRVRQTNDILQNVSNGAIVGSDKRKQSQMIAPNPFVFGKITSRKENIINKRQAGILQMRKSSSDDFQKPRPVRNKKQKTTEPKKMINPPELRSEQSMVTNVLTQMKKTFQNTGISNTVFSNGEAGKQCEVQYECSVVIDDDDEDDIILIDSPSPGTIRSERTSVKNSIMSMEETVSKLNRNGITIARTDGDEVQLVKDDSVVIEIF